MHSVIPQNGEVGGANGDFDKCCDPLGLRFSKIQHIQ